MASSGCRFGMGVGLTGNGRPGRDGAARVAVRGRAGRSWVRRVGLYVLGFTRR